MRRAVAIAALVLTACAAPPTTSTRPSPAIATGDEAVTIGSFNFTESEILGELYAQALERGGVPVIREFRLGPREFVEPALERGLIELVPEYTGSLLEFLTRRASATEDLGQVRRALTEELEARGLLLLGSAPAQDRNAFATTLAFASANRVTELSDLAGIDELTLGGPEECQHRPLCLPGLQDRYDLRFEGFVRLDLSGPLTADALARGVIDVGLVLTTSPILEDPDLLVLEDDRLLQPAEHVTPVLHGSVEDRIGPMVAEVLDAVSVDLTTEELRTLNADVDVRGASVAAAVADWLDAHGFPPAAGP